MNVSSFHYHSKYIYISIYLETEYKAILNCAKVWTTDQASYPSSIPNVWHTNNFDSLISHTFYLSRQEINTNIHA